MWISAETQGPINTDHIEQVAQTGDPVTLTIIMASGRELILVFDTEQQRSQAMQGLIAKMGGVSISDL